MALILPEALMAVICTVCGVGTLWATVAATQDPLQEADTCTPDHQQSALSQLLGCETRDTVIQLTLPNTSYSHIMPDHISVRRCGGTCSQRFTSCMPTKVVERSYQVQLVPLSSSQAGVALTECAEAIVVDHILCSCGCRTTEADCDLALHTFIHGECRCVCRDASARLGCLSTGNIWDEAFCQCLCQNREEWPTCPSGYAFNPAVGVCGCVSLSEYASTILEILVVILLLSLLLISAGLIHCYRTQTGLYRRRTSTMRPKSMTRLEASATNLRPPSSAEVRQGVGLDPARPSAECIPLHTIRGDADGEAAPAEAASGEGKGHRLTTLASMCYRIRGDGSSCRNPKGGGPGRDAGGSAKVSGEEVAAPKRNAAARLLLQPPSHKYIPISQTTSRSQSGSSMEEGLPSVAPPQEAELNLVSLPPSPEPPGHGGPLERIEED